MLHACGGEAPGPRSLTYVGSATCSGCHTPEHAAWAPSLHAAALRPAAPGRVLAGFDGVEREFGSLTTRPVRTADALAFETPDGQKSPRRLPLTYVLGRAQIEQFLTPTPGGRLQAVPIGYDTVAREWFDIFPEAPPPSEWTHWTNGGANANARCLFCHTTGYEKGYRAATDTFDTRWAEAGVACEACHGPGSVHVERSRRRQPEPAEPYGRVDSASCAPCHVRAVPIADGYTPGAPLADFFAPELLDTAAYHADGQLADEAFEWTSFEMSLMAARGVVCIDCHDPHGAGLRAEGDTLCLRCHPAALATPAHTHHPEDSEGARCVGCHMPPVVFMERDSRRDHRVARPDPEGAAAVGAPDACTRCHAGESATWAAARVREWYGPSATLLDRRTTGAAFRAARAGDGGAVPELLVLLGRDESAVRRASAARLLGHWAGRAGTIDALAAAAGDRDPLVRAGAASALGEAPAGSDGARSTLVRLASDPVRLVRIEAAFALRSADLQTLEPAERVAAEAAFTDWLAAEDAIAENPDASYNRAVFLAARGDAPGAEASYRTALRLWPDALPARQNLAMLLATAGREADAEREWRELLARAPGWPPAAFSLGLLYGRQGRSQEAVAQLEACLGRDPSYPRARYNLAILYEQHGDRTRARDAFAAATTDPAARGDALRELARLASEDGDAEAATRWRQEVERDGRTGR